MVSAEGLVAGLNSGDNKARARLWDQHYPEVYAICAQILGPGPDATDVAADLLTDFMFDYVRRLTHHRALRSYLRLMAVRRSTRYLHKRQTTEPIGFDEIKEQAGLDPEEAAGYATLMPRLGHCLGELTPKAQQAVRLRYSRQMTNEQIGSIVGGSKQYIGRLLRQSLELLKKCLERGTAGAEASTGEM